MKRLFAVVLVVVSVLSFIAFNVVNAATKNNDEEVVYGGKLQITHLDMVSVDPNGIETKCYASLVNDGIVLIVQIDDITYAKLKEGNVISGKIKVNNESEHIEYCFKFDKHNDWFNIKSHYGLND